MNNLRQKIGSDNTHYVHGLRGIASQHDGAGWSDAVSDGLGSVRGWLNGSQNFVSDVDYNPYGVPDASVDGYGFTGEMTDDNGLVYLRARYYNPNIGNFVSLDPFEGFDTSPMSLNGYSWVEGNVANATDPSGMFCIVPVIGWLGCAGSALLYGASALGILGAAYANPCTAPNYRHEECQALTQSIQRQMHNVVQWIIDGACDVAQRAIDVVDGSLNPPISRPIPQEPQSQPAPTPRVGRGINRQTLERILPWIARFALDRGIDWVIERVQPKSNEYNCHSRRTGVSWNRTAFIDLAVYPKPADILRQHFTNFQTLYSDIAISDGLYSIQPTVNKNWVECLISGLQQGVQIYPVEATINIGKVTDGNKYGINNGNHRFFATVFTGISIPINRTTFSFANTPIGNMTWDLTPLTSD